MIPRLFFCSVFVLPILTVHLPFPSVSWAQNDIGAAEKANDAGKQYYRQKDFSMAAQQFQKAIEQNPDARFYFNLCATREKLQQFEPALEACDAVYLHGPTEKLKAKTGQRAAAIRALWKRQRAEAGAWTGDTKAGRNPPLPKTDEAPSASSKMKSKDAEVVADKPKEKPYKWSLGATLGPVMNRTLGRDFNDSGIAIKLKADILFAPQSNIGLQLYGNIYDFARGNKAELQVIDLGAGFFWHKHLAGRFFFSPLAGVHLAILQPESRIFGGDSFGTLGFRLDARFQWVVNKKHEFTFTPLGINNYLPIANEISSNVSVSDAGFNDWGTTIAITLGYAYRFHTILPSFMTLE